MLLKSKICLLLVIVKMVQIITLHFLEESIKLRYKFYVNLLEIISKFCNITLTDIIHTQFVGMFIIYFHINPYLYFQRFICYNISNGCHVVLQLNNIYTKVAYFLKICYHT
jgi:hypothetical protein